MQIFVKPCLSVRLEPSKPCALSKLSFLLPAEMISRVLKNKLRELMRNVRSSSEEENKAVIAEFFGSFLHSPLFWRPAVSDQDFDVKKRLQERFPSCLSPEEVPCRKLRLAYSTYADMSSLNRNPRNGTYELLCTLVQSSLALIS